MMKKMEKSDIENIVRSALTESINFIESEISDKRIKAQRYFEGEVDIKLLDDCFDYLRMFNKCHIFSMKS